MNGQGKAEQGGSWIETKRKGRRVMISPDGIEYRGTAQEVREARLMPCARHRLAERLYIMRLAFKGHPEWREQFTLDACACRRSVIRENATVCDSFGRRHKYYHALDAREIIDLQAAARMVGKSESDFVRMCLMAGIEQARREGLAYTRHERLALDALTAAGL